MAAAQTISLQEFFLLDWPWGPEICLVAFTLYTAKKASDAVEKHMYWAESLIYSFVTSFGGSILAPFLIGAPPVVFTNDLALFFAFASWFLLWHFKLLIVYLMDVPGVTQLIVSLAEMNRFNFMSGRSLSTIEPPLWGPVLLGTIAGCGGLFLPFDKGFSSLKSGAPYVLQSAFFCSLVYHLVVEYPLVKSWLIGYIGNYDDATAAAIIVGLFVVKSVWESVGTSHHQPKRIPARKRKTQ